MAEEEFTYKIENVVATVTLQIEEKMDLMKIAGGYKDVEYNPEKFPGVVMRQYSPKATILIFASGKMVVTGLKKAKFAPEVVDIVIGRIKNCGLKVSKPEIVIQNIVASGDLKCMVDLNMGAVVMENAMYEPEVFPGLIFRMPDPYAVFLIFSTGKIVCTGTKSKDGVREATKKIFGLVREYGIAKDSIVEEEIEEDDMTFL